MSLTHLGILGLDSNLLQSKSIDTGMSDMRSVSRVCAHSSIVYVTYIIDKCVKRNASILIFQISIFINDILYRYFYLILIISIFEQEYRISDMVRKARIRL